MHSYSTPTDKSTVDDGGSRYMLSQCTTHRHFAGLREMDAKSNPFAAANRRAQEERERARREKEAEEWRQKQAEEAAERQRKREEARLERERRVMEQTKARLAEHTQLVEDELVRPLALPSRRSVAPFSPSKHGHYRWSLFAGRRPGTCWQYHTPAHCLLLSPSSAKFPPYCYIISSVSGESAKQRYARSSGKLSCVGSKKRRNSAGKRSDSGSKPRSVRDQKRSPIHRSMQLNKLNSPTVASLPPLPPSLSSVTGKKLRSAPAVSEK